MKVDMENGTNIKIYKGIKILYEDNHLLVCIKPEGMLSQEDSTKEQDILSLLKEYIKITYDKKGNVYLALLHRLDRRVSGVMVFAKTSKAASRLSNDIRLGLVNKIYYAIAKGIVNEKGRLVNNLAKVNEKAIEDNQNGKESILDYQRLSIININNNDYSLVKVNLHTGRFNQIRCQFSLAHHPLINDFKYGFKNETANNDFSHIGLFCVELSFIHPVTKERMLFTFDEVINRSDNEWIEYFKD